MIRPARKQVARLIKQGLSRDQIEVLIKNTRSAYLFGLYKQLFSGRLVEAAQLRGPGGWVKQIALIEHFPDHTRKLIARFDIRDVFCSGFKKKFISTLKMYLSQEASGQCRPRSFNQEPLMSSLLWAILTVACF